LQQAGVQVIGLSAHIEAARVAEMLQAGALGYVVKDRAGSDLPAAVRAVYQGKTYIRTQ
jgi:DNA-binding NarL/FixJ family response regulator